MKIAILICAVILPSCGTLPQLYQSTEHIADDTAIKMQVSQEALQKDSNIEMNIKLSNSQNR